MKPASMAKIMTAYIVFDRLQENISLDDKFIVSKSLEKRWIKNFSQVKFEVTIRDLVMGLIVQSGNDAAIVLAGGIGK